MTPEVRKKLQGNNGQGPTESVPALDAAGSVPRGNRERPKVLTDSTGRTMNWTARLWSIVKVGAGLSVVIGASLAVAWGARHYSLTSPRFALRDVQVQGNHRRTHEQVVRQAGLVLGTNVFSLDLEDAERRVLDDPWIREVKLTRVLPGTVRAEVTEREASAALSIGDALYLTTKAGEPFKLLEDGDPFDLPVITGISGLELARDRSGATERIQSAFRVLRDYERLPLSKIQVAQEVHLSEDGQVTLVVGKQGITLQLGQGPWGRKLAMAERVLARASQRGHSPGIIFLDNQAHPERVVVRMK